MSDNSPVEWNGNVYFTDPSDLTMGELETIAQRSDVTDFADLIGRLRRVDHIGWKALFWTQDRRRDPNLRWDGYEGPTFRVLLDAGAIWSQKRDQPDPEVEAGKEQTAADGSAVSPNDTDTPPPNSTG